jgi:Ca2+-binding EF-hand superfamily protein
MLSSVDLEVSKAANENPNRDVPAGRVVNDSVRQQLRGIFAAHDHDHDHMITRAQLVDVISMLGIRPSNELVARFFNARPDNAAPSLIDLQTFLKVASVELNSAPEVTPDLVELFELFDPDRTGMVTVKTLRHIMLEVLTPDRLSRSEFEEFLQCAMFNSATGYARRVPVGYAMEDYVHIDYRRLISSLLIGKPRQSIKVDV